QQRQDYKDRDSLEEGEGEEKDTDKNRGNGHNNNTINRATNNNGNNNGNDNDIKKLNKQKMSSTQSQQSKDDISLTTIPQPRSKPLRKYQVEFEDDSQPTYKLGPSSSQLPSSSNGNSKNKPRN